MATRLYPLSMDPSYLLNLQSIDAGDLVTPDGRSHPITGLSTLDEFTSSSAAVGITPDPSPTATGPTYNPGGIVNPGGGGTAPTWGDFYNSLIQNISGGTLTTSTGSGASSSPSTRFGVPHLGVRLVAIVIGIGIVLLVVARLVLRD